MQTNLAVGQSKIITWSESPWNQSGRKGKGLWRSEDNQWQHQTFLQTSFFRRPSPVRPKLTYKAYYTAAEALVWYCWCYWWW